MPETPDWTRDELVLVLDLYLREGVRPPEKAVSAMSRELLAMPVLPAETRLFNSRTPAAVEMKLGQFDALSTKTPTSRGVSQEVNNVWAAFTKPSGFGRDRQRLWAAVRDVRARYASPPGP